MWQADRILDEKLDVGGRRVLLVAWDPSWADKRDISAESLARWYGDEPGNATGGWSGTIKKEKGRRFFVRWDPTWTFESDLGECDAITEWDSARQRKKRKIVVD